MEIHQFSKCSLIHSYNQIFFFKSMHQLQPRKDKTTFSSWERIHLPIVIRHSYLRRYRFPAYSEKHLILERETLASVDSIIKSTFSIQLASV